jgi:hypothetical protein
LEKYWRISSPSSIAVGPRSVTRALNVICISGILLLTVCRARNLELAASATG